MKTYLFDLDGTLLDSLYDLAASTNYALRHHGLPEHSIDDVRCFVGNGVGQLIHRATPEGYPEDEEAKVLATFRAHYLLHALDHTQPYPGITSLLDRLHAEGHLIGIVSNKIQAGVDSLCQRFFPQADVEIGEGGGLRRKPFPDMVEEAIQRLRKVHPGTDSHLIGSAGTTISIGDSDIAVLTAKNAGLPCLSVLWGFRDRDFLLAHGATHLIEYPEEILRYKQ